VVPALGTAARGWLTARACLAGTSGRVPPDDHDLIVGLRRFTREKGQEEAAVALVCDTLLFPPFPDATGMFHLADTTLPDAFVVYKRATHLGHPAMDGRCLAVAAGLRRIPSNVDHADVTRGGCGGTGS